MSSVVCQLPKAGLGNQLFPLMKAHVFARMNGLPLLVTGYRQIKIGPYLRGERSKRSYRNYFTFEKNLFGAWLDQQKINRMVNMLDEPAIRKLDNLSGTNHYRFNKIPHWSNFFEGLIENRALTLQLFDEILSNNVKREVAALPSPVIGVHVRLGDFRKLAGDEEFSKVGAVRTPEKYFIDTIQAIRNVHGSDLPVSVFTDGYRHELIELFKLPNVHLVEGNSDMVDLLLLSKSKIIVASAGSTFSYWAGFLSNAPLILHPDHLHKNLRSLPGCALYEGPMDPTNKLLIESIKSIISTYE